MKSKPIIGITMGDFNGIGPEIALKALISPVVQKICSPILIGSTEVVERYAQLLRLTMNMREVEKPQRKIRDSFQQIVNSSPYAIPRIKTGTISREAGEFAGKAIIKAVELWKKTAIDAVVTAPVSKEAMNAGGYKFPGQTEMIAHYSGSANPMMMLVAGSFRIGLATIHIPLRDVAGSISKKLIVNKLSILHSSLRKDFGIPSPTIAVLGLNPHAGERGKIGKEELRVIHPALSHAKKLGFDVEGAFPADGFFGMHQYKHFHGVLAMYHDQGLIPLKMQGFEIGVNVTVGLPIVRTSPDHGTAFDIAGKGIANPSSMIEAIKLAVTIVNNRKKSVA